MRALLSVVVVLLCSTLGLVLGTVAAVPLCFGWQRLTGTRNDSYEAVIPFLLFCWPLGLVLGAWAAYRLTRREG